MNDFIRQQKALKTKITEKTLDQFEDYIAQCGYGYWLGQCGFTRLKQLRACVLLSEQTGRPIAYKLEKELNSYTFGTLPTPKSDWLGFEEIEAEVVPQLKKFLGK